MHRNARASAIGLCLALLASVAACSDDSDSSGEKKLDLSESNSASPTEESSNDGSDDASETPDAIPTSYPDVGLEFTSLPKVKGAKRAALETYVAFERGQRKLSRTASMNPLITKNAAPSAQQPLQNAIDWMHSNDTRYDGTARIDVSFEGAGAATATLNLCIDATDLALVTDGQKRPVEGRQRSASRVSLSNGGGTWLLTAYESLDESC